MDRRYDFETDLLVIGGGINGTGIAADAAGRGLSVVLCEQDDLASATSSYSSKLIHGGLRYLEQGAFRLVRESLYEREILLRKAPFLIHPIEFILPHEKKLRSRLLVRLGLFLYDNLSSYNSLSRSHGVKLFREFEGQAVKPAFKRGFSYTDCKTDDARLVVLNAIAAKEHGATILTRTRCDNTTREKDFWDVTLYDRNQHKTISVKARAIVNAAGPWVTQALDDIIKIPEHSNLQLIKGSHLVVNKLYEGEHAYILQNPDGRVVFVIPYQSNFTLIGTTDVPVDQSALKESLEISDEEIDYLCSTVDTYLKHSVKPEDIVWSFAGVRPLYDDESDNPSNTSRDYFLELDEQDDGAPALSVFGGKLTTYRPLAAQALDLLRRYFRRMGPAWTHKEPLPGGTLDGLTYTQFIANAKSVYRWLDSDLLERYAGQFGDNLHTLLKQTKRSDDLGRHFGAGLYEREIDYLIEHEWAQTCEDIIWRRTKLGLYLNSEEIRSIDAYMKKREY